MAPLYAPDFESLVGSPVQSATPFPDVHSGQASDVWLVETGHNCLIVRSSRLKTLPDMDFWVGVQALFGADPTDAHHLPFLHDFIAPRSGIPVPRMIQSKTVQGRTWHVVECLPGTTLKQFGDLPAPALQELGASTARLHTSTAGCFGRLDGQPSFPAESWPDKLTSTLRLLVDRYYSEDKAIAGGLAPMCALAQQLALPEFCPIMLDMDATQFLTDGERLTGLVDLEVYVCGPAAFELCMLEYLLPESGAAAFRQGYQTVRPFPDLEPVRALYRYLGLLLAVQGRVPFDKWMNQPVLF